MECLDFGGPGKSSNKKTKNSQYKIKNGWSVLTLEQDLEVQQQKKQKNNEYKNGFRLQTKAAPEVFDLNHQPKTNQVIKV